MLQKQEALSSSSKVHPWSQVKFSNSAHTSVTVSMKLKKKEPFCGKHKLYVGNKKKIDESKTLLVRNMKRVDNTIKTY